MSEMSGMSDDEQVAWLVKSIIEENDRVQEAIINAMRQSDPSAYIQHTVDADGAPKVCINGTFDMMAIAQAAITEIDEG